jgi:hypothetical protein
MTRSAAAIQPGVFELVAPYQPAGDQPAAIQSLVRGIEDALTEIVWTDDAVVVEQRNSKRWGLVPRVEIAVYELPGTVAELERQTQGQGVLV